MSKENIALRPIQKIIFGSPGTGKSHKAREIAKQDLAIDSDLRIVTTVFHPEYTYHDFIGKLLPQTEGTNIIYKFYPGHFLKVLSMAYKNLFEGQNDNFLLVIDELNRGNAASIFGSAFQLLDRDGKGWSSYGINISDLELGSILNDIGFSTTISSGQLLAKKASGGTLSLDELFNSDKSVVSEYLQPSISKIFKTSKKANPNYSEVIDCLRKGCIRIPSNLSIIATINTSDESIYYLDSAFKRRWDWEHIDAPHAKNSSVPDDIKKTYIEIEDDYISMPDLVISVNNFMRENHKSIRGIEDKQVGWWFINSPKFEDSEGDFIDSIEQIKDKLMFYLWDNVFGRDKLPLKTLLNKEELITYSDFAKLTKRVYQCCHVQVLIHHAKMINFEDLIFNYPETISTYSFVGIEMVNGELNLFLPKGFEKADLTDDYQTKKELYFLFYKILKKFGRILKARNIEIKNSHKYEQDKYKNLRGDRDGTIDRSFEISESTSSFNPENSSVDSANIIFYPKLFFIDRLLAEYDELKILSLSSRLVRSSDVNINDIHKYLHCATFLNNGAAYISSTTTLKKYIQFTSNDIVTMYCYLVAEVKEELGEIFSDEVKALSRQFKEKYIGNRHTLFGSYFDDILVGSLKSILEIIHQNTAIKRKRLLGFLQCNRFFPV